MVQYLLYKRRNNVMPFMVINPDTVDSTSTSMFFIGKQTTSYGQPQEQSLLWMLENFANTAAPAPAILGQEWFNSSDNKMYVCTNEGLQTFTKVGGPIISASTPAAGIIEAGDLWYNTTDDRLYGYDGSQWNLIGPATTIPVNIDTSYYLSAVTNSGASIEMLVQPSNTRLVMPVGSNYGTTWQFDIRAVARGEESISEVLSMKISGTIDYNNAGSSIALVGGLDTQILDITPTLTTANIVVSADSVNNSLKISAVGQSGKTLNWSAVVRITEISN